MRSFFLLPLLLGFSAPATAQAPYNNTCGPLPNGWDKPYRQGGGSPMTYFLMGKDVNSKKNNEWGVWNCDFNTKNSEWNVKDVDCDTANDKYMKKTGDSTVKWDGYGCTYYPPYEG